MKIAIDVLRRQLEKEQVQLLIARQNKDKGAQTIQEDREFQDRFNMAINRVESLKKGIQVLHSSMSGGRLWGEKVVNG